MLFWTLAALLTIGALLVMAWPVVARVRAAKVVSGAPPRGLLVLIAAVPILAVGAYLADGRPDLPDRPYAKREAERVAAGLPSDRERALVRELAAQMERHPENAEGWAMLGEAYVRDAHYEEAVAAFKDALALRPGDAAILSALGEALTLEAQGEITPEAEAFFREALKAQPGEQKARYFIALAKAQHGDADGARSDLTALLKEAAPDAPWRRAVEATLARIEMDLPTKKTLPN